MLEAMGKISIVSMEISASPNPPNIRVVFIHFLGNSGQLDVLIRG